MVKANANLALESSETFSVTFTYCDNFYNKGKLEFHHQEKFSISKFETNFWLTGF